MLFAGFNVAKGEYSLLVAHAGRRGRQPRRVLDRLRVGYFGRVDLIEKHGRKVLIKPHHLHKADDWFERYGDATVFFSRMLPIVRTFISLPAGVARMPFWRFTVLTDAGLHPLGLHARVHRQAGRRQLGGVEGAPALRRLRRASWRSCSAPCGCSCAGAAPRGREPARRRAAMPPEARAGRRARADPGRGRAAAGLLVGARRRGAVAARVVGRARGRRRAARSSRSRCTRARSWRWRRQLCGCGRTRGRWRCRWRRR